MPELPLKDKLTHDAVNYTHPSPSPTKDCGRCVHAIKAHPMRCQHVKPPIRWMDICDKFEPKAKA